CAATGRRVGRCLHGGRAGGRLLLRARCGRAVEAIAFEQDRPEARRSRGRRNLRGPGCRRGRLGRTPHAIEPGIGHAIRRMKLYGELAGWWPVFSDPEEYRLEDSHLSMVLCKSTNPAAR